MMALLVLVVLLLFVVVLVVVLVVVAVLRSGGLATLGRDCGSQLALLLGLLEIVGDAADDGRRFLLGAALLHRASLSQSPWLAAMRRR